MPVEVTNTWHHACLNWDGTTHRLFLDGVLKDSATNVPAIYTGIKTDFGGSSKLSAYDLDGQMDQIMVEYPDADEVLEHSFVPNNVGYSDTMRSFIFFGADEGNNSNYECNTSGTVEVVDFGNRDGWTTDLNFYATCYRALPDDSKYDGNFNFSVTTSNSSSDPVWGILAFGDAEPRQYVGPSEASSLTMNNIQEGSAILVLAFDRVSTSAQTPPSGFTEIIDHGVASSGTNSRAYAAWKSNASSTETVNKVGDLFMLVEITPVGDPADVTVSLLGNSYGDGNNVTSFTATAPTV